MKPALALTLVILAVSAFFLARNVFGTLKGKNRGAVPISPGLATKTSAACQASQKRAHGPKSPMSSR